MWNVCKTGWKIGKVALHEKTGYLTLIISRTCMVEGESHGAYTHTFTHSVEVIRNFNWMSMCCTFLHILCMEHKRSEHKDEQMIQRQLKPQGIGIRIITCDSLFLFLILLAPLCLLDEQCIYLQLLPNKSPKHSITSDNTHFYLICFLCVKCPW